MRARLIIVIGLLVPIGACGMAPVGPAGDPLSPQHVALDAPVTLAPGETAVVDRTPLRIVFVAVTEDSRCPSTVVCVWEGRALVALRVHDGREERTVTLETRAGVKHGGDFGGYFLEIVGLLPYPETEQPIEPEDYRLTLRVTPTE